MPALNATGKYYVSVTSLVVKNILVLPKFGYYTMLCAKAAKSSEGNISTLTTSYKGLQVTITAWESREKMLVFLRGDAHAAAMKQTKSLGSYAKFHGYYTDELPTEANAIKALLEDGRLVHGDPNPIYGDVVEENNSSSEDE